MKTLKLLFVGFIALGMILCAGAQADLIMVPDDYPTIQAAVDNATAGDTIMVAPGDYAGAIVTKRVEIIGTGGARIITPVDYPYPPLIGVKACFIFLPDNDASGTKISNFELVNIISYPKFAVWGVVGHYANNVTINHLNIDNFGRGINYSGCSGWNVTHNNITNSDAGILLFGVNLFNVSPIPETSENLIAFNTVNVSGTGIQVFAYRYPASGTEDVNAPLFVHNNKIVHNKVVGNRGIYLRDPEIGHINGNYIGFNDFRGSTTEIVEAQSGVLSNNTVSRNLGKNLGVTASPPAEDEAPADIFNPQPPQ